MMYFKELVGKGIGIDDVGNLFLYFSLIAVPLALPLAILLASLMCFGNLGEHTELTALKSAGIPIWRILLPTAIVAVMVSFGAFYYNNYISPKANLKGYSLLYDIKTTKLTLNIEEGIFYEEIPNYRIKVSKKFPDNKTLKGIVVYDHSGNDGNRNVTLADSGRMFTLYDAQYLVFELFNGTTYVEGRGDDNALNDTRLTRNKFKSNKMVFSLESFGMKRTSEDQFKYHEFMKNTSELKIQVDSLGKQLEKSRSQQAEVLKRTHSYQFKPIGQEPLLVEKTKDTLQRTKNILPGAWVLKKIDTLKTDYNKHQILQTAISNVENVGLQISSSKLSLDAKQREMLRADVERWHKYTLSFACFVMFLIGASLGSIIKKGGFGMPVLLSISFFILMYVLMQLGDKYAKEGFIPVITGVWSPDIFLLFVGLFLLYKATNDARLFEKDVYLMAFARAKEFVRFKKK
jgi:lipopolysaccharide export system permease protein